ncbi:MAG: hypothetical protein KY464_00330 [Gemmatimonadetes bacterium]|nr:hypothetical protein [Gemmatimonadota bacterium]
MSRRYVLSSALLVGLCPAVATAQAGTQAAAAAPRPVPEVVVPSPAFEAAVTRGTRTATGRPGARYWQNWADYRVRVRVLPEAKRVEGTTTIRYQNRSPEAMRGVALDVLQRADSVAALTAQIGPAALPVLPTADAWCSYCPWFLPASTDVTACCPGHVAAAPALAPPTTPDSAGDVPAAPAAPAA